MHLHMNFGAQSEKRKAMVCAPYGQLAKPFLRCIKVYHRHMHSTNPYRYTGGLPFAIGLAEARFVSTPLLEQSRLQHGPATYHGHTKYASTD